MKNQIQIKMKRISLIKFMSVACFILLASPMIHSQTTTYQPDKSVFKDIKIPQNTQSKFLFLELKGGDGGKASEGPMGGRGAIISAYFEIGNEPNQIQPGSKLRLIPGQKGENGPKGSGGVGGGGGGGTAVLVLTPDRTSWSWSKELIVAGGGGGAGTDQDGKGATGNPNGKASKGNGDDYDEDNCINCRKGGDAGSLGKNGESSNLASGGASGNYNAKWVFQPADSKGWGAKKGHPAGGDGAPGGYNSIGGGWGYGGGGATSKKGGGGGGGYTGGGAGGGVYHKNGFDPYGGAGGAGGSIVSNHYNSFDVSHEDAETTNNPTNGYVKYNFYSNPNITIKDFSFLDNFKLAVDGSSANGLYFTEKITDGIGFPLPKIKIPADGLSSAIMYPRMDIRLAFVDKDTPSQLYNKHYLAYFLTYDQGMVVNEDDVKTTLEDGAKQWIVEPDYYSNTDLIFTWYYKEGGSYKILNNKKSDNNLYNPGIEGKVEIAFKEAANEIRKTIFFTVPGS